MAFGPTYSKNAGAQMGKGPVKRHVKEPAKEDELTCECGFKSKSKGGLAAHKRSHE